MDPSSFSKHTYRKPIPNLDLPHLTEDLLTRVPKGSKSAVNSPKNSIAEKIKLLNDIGFANYGSESPPMISNTSPRICVADFLGGHEKFLKRAGFWEAYQKMQNKEKIARIRADSNISKPGNPHIMDINLERKIMFEQQKRNTDAVKLPSENVLLPSYPDRIAHLNKLLNDDQKSTGSIGFRILPPTRNKTLKKKISSLPGLSKHIRKAQKIKFINHNLLDLL